MKIAIIGLGAVGSWAATLLLHSLSAQSQKRGRKTELLLIDRDIVEKHSLKYQNYSEKNVGLPKAEAMARKIKNAVGLPIDLDSFNIEQALKGTQLIIDCTDNLETRLLINNFCMKNKIPWIYSGAVASTGVVALFDFSSSFSPGFLRPRRTQSEPTRRAEQKGCFECVFDTNTRTGKLQTCTSVGLYNGINNDVAYAIAMTVGNKTQNGLMYLNSSTNTSTFFKIKQNQNCHACKGEYFFLDNKQNMYKTQITEFCGNIFQIKPPFVKKEIIGNAKKINDSITLFPDGRALIKAKDKNEARTLYSRYVST